MKKTIFIFALFSLAAFCNVFAEEIGGITFIQKGSYTFPEEMLKFHLKSRSGDEFDRQVLDEDIKRLVETGQFKDISVETSTDDGKRNITLTIVPQPRIKKLVFKGNEKFDDTELKEKVSLDAGSPLNDKQLRKDLESLRNFYSSEGYYAAVISHETMGVGEDLVELTFNIEENLRRRIASVSFSGATVYSEWFMRRKIATAHSYWSWLIDTGLLDENEIENDKQRLRDLYWEKGYLDFRVKDVQITPRENPEKVDVVFELEEGKAYRIGEVAVTGNTKFDAETIAGLIPLKTDDIYDIRKEREGLRAIAEKYNRLGHADFNCSISRVPDLDTHSLDLEYRISEGIPYKVRHVKISGNHKTKDKVLRREMTLEYGDPVDKEEMLVSRKRLMALNYFEKVSVVSAGAEEEGKKDIEVRVEEKQTAEFSIGGGYSDTHSVLGVIKLEENNFDISNPENYFAGGGQRLSLRGQLGLEESEAAISFTEPWLFDRPVSLNIEGYYHTRIYEDWDETHAGGELSLAYRFMDYNSVGGGYRLESVRVQDMDDDLSSIFQEEEGTDTVSSIFVTLKRDTRDDIVEPASGYLLSLRNELTTKALGASENYYRIEGKASGYFPFLNEALILHLGGRAGHVNDFGSTDRPPIYERYFLGGGTTIRGFKYREISPADANEDPYGGESMYMLTAEITHPIYDFIRGAAFVDAGNVYRDSDFDDFDIDSINVGVGYGLRIRVPHLNAPVKLDLAYPVVKDQSHIDRKLRFHFNLGFTW